MQTRTLALIICATLAGVGCASKESKPEPTPAAAPAAATTPTPTPVAAKPECQPEPTAKIKSSKSKNSKKKAPPPVDCEPRATTNSKPAPAASTAVAPAPASTAKPAEAGKPRIMKSRDGTFEGEVYGNIPPNSKWAKLQIGMEQPEVERILGGTSHDIRTMPTGKAFIPFYYGTDRYRYEVVYHGQGSVSYTGGSWGGGRGVLMMINYDPNI